MGLSAFNRVRREALEKVKKEKTEKVETVEKDGEQVEKKPSRRK